MKHIVVGGKMSSDLKNLRSHVHSDAQSNVPARDHEAESAAHANAWCRFVVSVGVCLFLAFAGSYSVGQTEEVTPDMAMVAHNIKTVFVIIMENHNWTHAGIYSLKGNPLAPYINYTLVPMGSHASNYFNPPGLHPSLPNYLWLEAGTNFGIRDNKGPMRNSQPTGQHLVALLEKKGISWKSYDERASGWECPIQYWHDPFVFFGDVTNNNNRWSAHCIEHIRPTAELDRDLQANKVARYNFIVPNVCNSMHTVCGNYNLIEQGDKWLAKTVPPILRSSAYRNNGLLIILFDEGGVGDGPIPLLVLSPLAKSNGYTNYLYYTHGSTLRTIQEIFGVYPLLGDAAKQRDLRDLFITFP
jgi:hypothetical protein